MKSEPEVTEKKRFTILDQDVQKMEIWISGIKFILALSILYTGEKWRTVIRQTYAKQSK